MYILIEVDGNERHIATISMNYRVNALYNVMEEYKVNCHEWSEIGNKTIITYDDYSKRYFVIMAV